MAISQKEHIGRLGEDIACRYLEGKGFSVLERNYLRKWGEIDIIARKGGILYFVEVKAVSRSLASHETSPLAGGEAHRPEDNVHPRKLERLSRAIRSYLLEHNLEEDSPWQLDVVTVRLDAEKKAAEVSRIENIVL